VSELEAGEGGLDIMAVSARQYQQRQPWLKQRAAGEDGHTRGTFTTVSTGEIWLLDK